MTRPDLPPPGVAPHRSTLDGLRFLAFLAVFCFHAESPRLPCPWGWGGVSVFFTLSGFLITRILIRDETGHLGVDLRRFYVRRALRIFPLYYGLIAYFGLAGELEHGPWLLAYLANVKGYFARTGDPMLGHFWTLSVEEQFYLGFPPLLYLTHRRLRPALVLAMIAGSVGFQVYAQATGKMPFAKWLLPYCASDLGWGALAGMVELRARARRFQASALVAAGVGLLWLSWQLHERQLGLSPAWQSVAGPTALGLGSACLVFGLWRTTNPLLTRTLGAAPVAYLGRISYGLYAFHMPVLRGAWAVEVPYAFLIPEVYRSLIQTVLLSALSWRFFEGPINRLKDRLAPRPAGFARGA